MTLHNKTTIKITGMDTIEQAVMEGNEQQPKIIQTVNGAAVRNTTAEQEAAKAAAKASYHPAIEGPSFGKLEYDPNV